jgi:outer membrane protein TolC
MSLSAASARRRTIVLALGAFTAGAPAARAQWPATTATTATTRADSLPLSLADAVQLATSRGEEVRVARTQVDLAETDVAAARSQALPQLGATLGYQRTLRNPYASGLGGFSFPSFSPDTTASLEERVRYLEKNAPVAPFSALGSLVSGLGIVAPNAYSIGLTGSQTLFAGGRIAAGMRAAEAGRRAAEATLTEQTAEVVQQVRAAYYQALLAQEAAVITDSSAAQAERFLAQQRLRLEAGQGSELEVLRAEVSRDNLRPQQVQARNQRDLALLNLKRLVNVPLTQPVRLATRLEAPPPDSASVDVPPETLTAQRASLRAAEAQVDASAQQVRIAKGAMLPSLALQTNFAPSYLSTDAFRNLGAPRTNWTVGLGVQAPLFQGGKLRADVRRAQAQLEQSRLQFAQLREAVQVEYEQARLERARARAEITARQRTVDQAQRVYDLTVLRYGEGVATQLEVSSSRLDLLQARTNLAQSIADFYVADAGVARALSGVTAAPNASTPNATTPVPTARPVPQ